MDLFVAVDASKPADTIPQIEDRPCTPVGLLLGPEKIIKGSAQGFFDQAGFVMLFDEVCRVDHAKTGWFEQLAGCLGIAKFADRKTCRQHHDDGFGIGSFNFQFLFSRQCQPRVFEILPDDPAIGHPTVDPMDNAATRIGERNDFETIERICFHAP